MKVEPTGFPDNWWMGEKEESRMTPRFLAWAMGRMELSSAVGGAEFNVVTLSLRYASGDLGQLLAG